MFTLNFVLQISMTKSRVQVYVILHSLALPVHALLKTPIKP